MSKTTEVIDKNKEFYERAYILIPILSNADTDEAERLEECTALLKTAGADVLGVTSQKIRSVTPSTFMGEGKIEDVKSEIERVGADMAVFDGELSPSQVLNISNILGGIKVIDRPTLILDIFAKNALTKEGKLQVELAQLEYIYPRLKGKGEALSRLGGGVGTRGPGETRLETDRRHIRRRINAIKTALAEIETRRNLSTKRREKNHAITVALTGYTNAGKSTLLNLLSGSDIPAEDKLFATLDPTARKIDLGDFSVIMIDTVGFIRNIPTELIEAFKSTLESAASADVILNVADASANFTNQFSVTEQTLRALGCNSPIIKVLNKCDKICNFNGLPSDAILISAKDNTGIDELKGRIASAVKSDYSFIDIKIPIEKISKFYATADYAESYDISYSDDYALIRVVVKNAFVTKFTSI